VSDEADSVTEDEFAQLPESQEEKDGKAMDEDRRAGGQDEGAPIQLGMRHRNTRRVHANGTNATRRSGALRIPRGTPSARSGSKPGPPTDRNVSGQPSIGGPGQAKGEVRG